MTNNHRTHRPNRNQRRNPPILLERKRHSNHNSRHAKAEHEAPLETSKYLADRHKERNVFGFLRGGAPLERDAQEVADESLRDMQGDTAEEDGEERDPL